MNLYPQDLREDYHWQIVVLREGSPTMIPQTRETLLAKPRTKRPIGFFGKLWLNKLPLTHRQAEVTLNSLSAIDPGMSWFGYILFTVLSVGTLGVMPYSTEITTAPQAVAIGVLLSGMLFHFFFVSSSRGMLKRLYCPISLPDIEGLVPSSQADLERAYLALVRDTVLQTVPEEAEDDVRTAIVAISEAMDALPPVDPVLTDTSLLRGEAIALRAQAASEADMVIADSLRYQAEAVLRRADAADRSAQYARRIAALRREIGAQIAAVQEELSTFSSTAGSIVDRVALSHLAESARRVAAISVSASNARAELDRFSSPLLRQTSLAADELAVSTVQNLQRTIK